MNITGLPSTGLPYGLKLRLKSLRTFKFSPRCLTTEPGMYLSTLLSTSISPDFNLVLIYKRADFGTNCVLRQPGHVDHVREPEKESGFGCPRCDLHREILGKIIEALKKTDKVVRLVLCVEVQPIDVTLRKAQATVEFTTTILKLYVEELLSGESGLQLLPNVSIISTMRYNCGQDYNIVRKMNLK